MRAVATLLLALMAAVFIAATIWRDVHPALPWVRAFAEAAMVGGLADWFAVTALFRHPLGLPIPHTAIIPANKDRIGDSLASFLKDNFLTPSVVARRLEAVDMAGAAARWLTAERVAVPGRKRGLRPMVARLIEAMDSPAMGSLVRDTATAKLRELNLAPVVADAIDATLAKRRHEPLVDAALDWGLATLDSQEPTIRGMVADRTSWFLRLVNVDDRVANSLIDGVRKLLAEMRHEPFHPLRGRISDSLANFAFDLRHFPETQAGIEAWKSDLIANPALGAWLEGLWADARTSLVRSLTSPSEGPGRLDAALRALGERLEADQPLRAAINLHLRRAAVGLTSDYGDGIVSLVSTTVRGWDASTVTEKLETAVGRDLQFIRINGTIIGGLVGVAIHALTLAL